MTDRTALTWADLGETYDGPHATPRRVDKGPFFLNISSLNSGRLDLSQSDHVSDEEFVKWTRRVTPQENDLLFSYETRLGEAALMPGGIKACLGRRMALLRPDPDVIHPRFLLYYYLSPTFQQLIDQNTIHGATVNRISLSTMGSWPVEIPPIQVQEAIAEVLGALDDKIAANNKLVETLVATFTAHWRALSLLSTAETVTVSSLLGNMIGGDWGTAEATEASPNEVRCVRGADIADLQKSGLGKMPRRFLKTASLKRRKLKEGDLVVEMSGGSPTQSTGRSVLITASLLARLDVPLTSSNFCRIIRPTDPAHAFYLYGLLQDSWQRGEFFSFENGSTGIKNLAFADYSSTKIVALPSAEKLKSFNELARSLFDTMQSLGTESSRLAVTRDALIPPLMSGKIRVMDAEKAVEDAL